MFCASVKFLSVNNLIAELCQHELRFLIIIVEFGSCPTAVAAAPPLSAPLGAVSGSSNSSDSSIVGLSSGLEPPTQQRADVPPEDPLPPPPGP